MWYYSTDGKQQGPLDDVALDSLIATGVVTPATYVWKDGMAEWTPLGRARPSASPAVVAPAIDAASCSVCGRQVGDDNLIQLLGNRVCAECKPMALQTLKEGVSLPARNFTAWRDGRSVVAQSNTSLPARCFKCNQPVDNAPITRKLTWHQAFWYVLLFFNVIIYVIAAMIVRKRATVDIYVCPHHQQRRKFFMLGGWGGAALGIGLFIAGAVLNTVWMIFAGLVVILAATITGIAGAQLVRTAKIKGETVWINGAGKEFVASLPDWPGKS